ncbi:MAG TPA: hypothetical protein VIU46_05095 [Gallionellaceae bacterium]
MSTTRLLTLSACAALVLGACTPKPHLTTEDVKNVVGLSMGAVDAKLGRASSITDAGDSVWWEYINIIKPNGNTDGSCHIVFRKNVAVEVKC